MLGFLNDLLSLWRVRVEEISKSNLLVMWHGDNLFVAEKYIQIQKLFDGPVIKALSYVWKELLLFCSYKVLI